MESKLRLLHHTAQTLAQAASFFVSSKTEYAARARRKANRRRPGKPGKTAFHPAILSSLTLLCSLLQPDSDPRDTSDPDLFLAVEETLSVFERLVGDFDKKKSYPASYRGLHELKTQYEAVELDARRPKPPGFRRHLYCPSPELQALLKGAIDDCCDALAQATVSTDKVEDTASILAETQSVQEWKAPPALNEHPEKLRAVLSKFSSCGCESAHDDVGIAFSNNSNRRADTRGRTDFVTLVQHPRPDRGG